MAITIIQQPQALTLVGVIPDIIVETTGLGMVLNLKIGSTVILSEYYVADAAGRARVNLRDFIDNQLHVDLPGDVNLYEQTRSWRTFTVEITVGVETAEFSFIALKGGSSKLTLDCAAFLRDAWLTWQTQTKRVRDTDPEWISYYAQYDSVVKCRAYFSGGSSETIDLHTLEAGKHYTINATFSDIREEFVSQPIYFDLWVENSGGTVFSTWHMRYVLTTEEFDYPDLFLFKNGLGGIDTIRFTGEKRAVNPMEVSAALFFDEYEQDYLVTPRLAFEKNTGYFPSREAMLWAQDFFLNKERFILEEEELIPIRLISPETLTQDHVLVAYEFTYGYTRQTPYLALFKKKNPLIDPIIIGPGDEEFYLPPVISEFPQQTDPTGLLFPVQQPGTPGWSFVTWETLLEAVLAAVGTPTPGVTEHNELTGLQGGQEDQYYHLTREELIKIQTVVENVSPNALITFGTVTFTSPTSATLNGFKWIISGVEREANDVVKTTLGFPTTYPRPDFFVGLADGSVAYRPSDTDAFGNPILPDVASDEVLLAVAIRDPDTVTSIIPPAEFLIPPFPDTLFQTAVQADTTGLYAKVWSGPVVENGTYHIQLAYGSPSSDADWSTEEPGRSGILNAIFYCHNTAALTGVLLETIDGNSKPGDWALIRVGSELSLYHKSSAYWMRTYYRAVLLAGVANRTQLFNRQVYAALPARDQLYESVPLATGGTSLDADIVDALEAANTPSGTNPFATMDDIPAIPGPELSDDELDAIQGSNAPSASNVFATMADVGGGGGADTNAVHYNSSDGKSASEKQQARDNIGSTAGIPVLVTTGIPRNYNRTSNFVIARRGINNDPINSFSAGQDGEEFLLFCDNPGFPHLINHEDTLSTDVNRIHLYGVTSLRVNQGSFVLFRYNGKISRWIISSIWGNGNASSIDYSNDVFKVTRIIRDYANNGAELWSLFTGTSGSEKVISAKRQGIEFGKIINCEGGLQTIPGASPGTIGFTWNTSINNAFNFQHNGVQHSSFGVFGWVLGNSLVIRNGFGGATTIQLSTNGRITNARSGASGEAINRSEQLLLYPITITTAGTVNDLAETAGNFNYYLTACTQLNGMAGGENGKERVIQNDNTVDMVIAHQNTGSIAANRFNLIGAVNLTVPAGGIAIFTYKTTISRWVLKSKNF